MQDDEDSTERDLSYEFSMPNPLKRAMADLVNAIANTARTFDPNNTNTELSRTLLAIVLGQAFEVPDAAAAVERILPPGYVDPMIAAAQAQQGGGGGAPGGGPPPLVGQDPNQPNFFGPQGEGGPGQGPDGEQNPYGVPGFSSNFQDNQGQINESEEPEQRVDLEALLEQELAEALDELLAHASVNGNGNGAHP